MEMPFAGSTRPSAALCTGLQTGVGRCVGGGWGASAAAAAAGSAAAARCAACETANCPASASRAPQQNACKQRPPARLAPTGVERAHLIDMSAAFTSHTALASNHTSGMSVSPYLRVADCSIEGYNRLKVKPLKMKVRLRGGWASLAAAQWLATTPLQWRDVSGTHSSRQPLRTPSRTHTRTAACQAARPPPTCSTAWLQE